jgi:hypothetical protein
VGDETKTAEARAFSKNYSKTRDMVDGAVKAMYAKIPVAPV